VQAIYIADQAGFPPSQTSFAVTDVHLDIQPFSFHEETPFQAVSLQASEDHCIQMHATHLPHASFHGLCESLIYDDHLPSRLIRFITRMAKMTAEPQLNPHLVNFNRLVLLHGSSGTGKTTLCRAIAYKLSIRMRRRFPKLLLLELNTSSMFTKWFGESPGLVDQAFKTAFDAAADPSNFICLMIDEIESIAGCREHSLGAQEVADAARVTSQLLIALDKMRQMPNMLMLCTTNLLSAVVRFSIVITLLPCISRD
jgi:pachytene checkpoint protein 2